MAEFRLRPKAVGDIDAIWKYTYRTWSLEQANHYAAQIYAACLRVASNPALGKKYDGISDGLLGFRTGRHVVFYRVVTSGDIVIVRILHGQMDLKNRIGE